MGMPSAGSYDTYGVHGTTARCSSLGLEVFIDADFVGNWAQQYVTDDHDRAQS